MVAVLGVGAEIITPLGDTLKGQGFLGSSFAALVALVLYSAISESGQQEVDGVEILADMNDISASVRTAFEDRKVQIDFSGFTMQTLLELLGAPLRKMADELVQTQELSLRITVVHLNSPMNLPGRLESPPAHSSLPPGTLLYMDSDKNRERMREDFTKKNWNELKYLLEQAQIKNPSTRIRCEIRESPQSPSYKLYVFNQQYVYFAPYGITDTTITWRGDPYYILDAEGFGKRHGAARIIGWDKRSESWSTCRIAEHHMEWFENLWKVLENKKPPVPVILDPIWPEPPGGQPTG
ncbi:hypothetical protein [Streptomyces sp. NPDC047525]|uniref:hypothetical protein n=1 Tax=Streptomyces sp. NPDC047525 TaxID=3155264 RepID=UPI0033CB9601